MNKKYVVGIVILLIVVIGLISSISINSQNDSSVYLNITCDNKDISGNYKKGDRFECILSGNSFEITIKDISSEKIKLSSSTYGLFPEREDNSISLTDKINEFELNKGKTLVLALQATDISSNIIINWE